MRPPAEAEGRDARGGVMGRSWRLAASRLRPYSWSCERLIPGPQEPTIPEPTQPGSGYMCIDEMQNASPPHCVCPMREWIARARRI